MSDYPSLNEFDHDTDFCEFPVQTSYFPISDARESLWTTEQFVQASKTRRELHSLQSLSPRRAIDIDIELPKIRQISGGFLRENGRLLYTVKHCAVRKCMDYAREHWSLPPKTSSSILALAALESFLNPFDPTHWLFWSNDSKDHSARMVQSHISRQNTTIYHPFSFSALDWRWRLHGLHNKQLPQVLSHFPWYDLLVLPSFLKDTPRGPVLRKRKVQPPSNIGISSHSSDLTDDLEPLPARRSRVNRARVEAALPQSQSANDNLSNPNIPLAISTKVTLSDSRTFLESPNSQTSQKPDEDSHQPSHGSVSATSTISSPRSISIVLPPPEHSRTRSSSRLSAQTLVEENRDNSPSISSSSTAEPFSTKSKVKRKTIDEFDSVAVVGVFDIVPEDDASPTTLSFLDEEPDIPMPRLTRARGDDNKITQTPPFGPQRAKSTRKNRANRAAPYPSGKSGGVGAEVPPNKIDHDAITSSMRSKKVRKGKVKSRRR
ncbi:hypothetical protein D9757_000691 [Collybiopsis confluens]|uniref:Uncharacterized protein n=1 Tax=Collybiopsis confluens TaxID=2823264 RepID=A0A8H5MGW4_9AGAR|nr:hypothetical protein D9757_000691 [Collybiopsis confluens]